MKALSVRQPWIWAIFNLGKDVENRKWSTTYRGPLLLHAARTLASNAWFRHPEDVPRGGIVGLVDLVDVVENHTSIWYKQGQFAWVFKNFRAVQFIPMCGQAGLFDVDDKLIKVA